MSRLWRKGAERDARKAREAQGAAGEAAPAKAVREEDGSYRLPAEARLEALPRLACQEEGRAFACVTEALPLPPAGLAYVVELLAAPEPHAEPGAQSEPGAHAEPGVQPGSQAHAEPQARVRVRAYVDRYARVFATDDVLAMPPARTPELRFVRAGDGAGTSARGAVELAGPAGRTWRVASFSRSDDGMVSLADARVELGAEAAAPLSLVQAAGVAFVAFSLLPAEGGADLSATSVPDAFGLLRASDLLDGVAQIVKAADAARASSLLKPPGVLMYLARMLRATGAVGKTLADLAAPRPMPAIAGLAWAFAGASADQGPLVSMTPPTPRPDVRLVRTSDYANLFYVAFSRDQVSDEGATLLLEVESVLNRFLLMARMLDERDATEIATEEQCAELDRWIVESILDEGAGLRARLTGERTGRETSESPDMSARITLAQTCESLRLPYRLEYRFRYRAQAGALAIDVTTPPACLMPHDAWDAAARSWHALSQVERNGDAARYAFHLAILMATAGFAASEGVREVVVNAWHDGWGVHGNPACVLTARFERGAFVDALKVDDLTGRAAGAGRSAAHPACPQEPRVAWYAADPFSFVRACPHAFMMGTDYALGRVRPLADLDAPDAIAAPLLASPEEDDRPLSPRASELLRAGRVAEMSIYEDTPRRPLAREVMEALAHEEPREVLALLRDMHDRTENVPVRRACLKLSEAVASGELTAQSEGRVRAAFSDVYGLQEGLRGAIRGLGKDPLRGVADIEALVRGADEARWFADGPTRAYRYFDCYASRALYAYRCGDDLAGRELRLAADEYFLAHHRLATLLSSSIDRGEEAIAHAERCVALAPSVAASHLRLARCYFSLFDYRSEVEALKRMLRVAWSPTDVGMALYWMGYAYWMLGEKAVGTACYQRCVAFDSSLLESATNELTDFLRKDGTVPRAMMTDDEMAAIFARAGVPVADVFDNVAFLARAAGAVLESGSYPLAQNLLGSAAAMLHDDAMAPVIESLGE